MIISVGGVLGPEKKIDRTKIAAIVFNHPEKLQDLNAMVHPLVYQEWHVRLEKIKAQDPQAIVLSDVPLLFEGRMQYLFDLTILVRIPGPEQINRLKARNSMTQEEAEARLNCQMPINDKIPLADFVIDNEGTIKETAKKVEAVWQELLRRENLKAGG